MTAFSIALDTCHWCLSQSVTYDAFDYEGDAIWQNGHCENCGGRQQLVYAVAGIAPRTDGSRPYRLTELDRGFPLAEHEVGTS